MADITYTYSTTQQRAAAGITPGKGDANVLRVLAITSITTATVVAQNSTFFVGRIPANARISSLSRVSWADLSNAASPTLDIGLASVGSNITSDDDALSADHDLSTATLTGAKLLTNNANAGKMAWELVSGQTTNPGGELDIYATVKDAATAISGVIMFEVYGYTD
jgi:hypothetical protein